MTHRRMILRNARAITPKAVIESARVVWEDDTIIEVGPLGGLSEGIDIGGQFVMPALVDLHNDGLEKAVNPRPKAAFPEDLSFRYFDRYLATTGIGTEFNAVYFSDNLEEGRGTAQAVRWSRMLLKAHLSDDCLVEHHVLHRWDIVNSTDPTALWSSTEGWRIKMVSLNEHIPGKGQYRNIDGYRAIKQAMTGMNPGEIDSWIDARLRLQTSPGAWESVAAEAQRRGCILVSHDDDTVEKVDLMASIGVAICEFPVTIEAARHARKKGLLVSMGAPNLLRGGSLSGNVSALELASLGLVDILCADYYAPALVAGVFRLVDLGVLSLPRAVSLVTSTPARAVGLTDRGRLEAGLRADLIVVALSGGIPLTKALFRNGRVCQVNSYEPWCGAGVASLAS